MAFDRPLEADSVDELGLLSSFVQAPILGPLMWILGGTTEKNNPRSERITIINAKENNSVETYKRVYHRNMTDVASADCSYAGDDICSTDADSSDDSRSDDSTKVDHGSANIKQRSRGLKNKTKMSWSDESGQSLVEYCDESQSSGQLLQAAANTSQKSIRKPIKSAIRKSRKGSSNLPCHSSQCLPSGLSGGSISMPSGGGIIKAGNVALNGSNGYISPQWGWYISTTPPSPEKYYSNVANDNEEKLIQQPESESQPSKSAILPTFKRVTNVAPNCTHGWPSVPL